jgi:hypothetical protein
MRGTLQIRDKGLRGTKTRFAALRRTKVRRLLYFLFWALLVLRSLNAKCPSLLFPASPLRDDLPRRLPPACLVVSLQLSIYSKEGGSLKGEIPLSGASRAWLGGSDKSFTLMSGKKYDFESHAFPPAVTWVQALNGIALELRALIRTMCCRCY